MDTRKAGVVTAIAGVSAGVVGLALLAVPAGAGPSPTLPPISAEQLVESVLTTQPPALGGTIEVDNALGLPAVPNLPQAANGSSQVRVWTDGTGRSRVSLPRAGAEQTIVNDGDTVWLWNSAERKVTKTTRPDGAEKQLDPDRLRPTDPASAARELVSAVRGSSNITVDGTAEVAGRAAYELVLTPAPTERTLLREVRVAVDAEKRVPLRLVVLANGSNDPALRIGFTELNVGQQDPALFRFIPPAGVTVEDKTEELQARGHGEKPAKPAGQPPLRVVNEGWDTTLVGRLPQQAPDRDEQDRRGRPTDLLGTIQRLGTPVAGSWGTGTLISTKVGTALVTSDGRFAVGAVPQQVLTEAIGTVR